MKSVWMIVVLLLCTGWAGAQHSEDDQERDHEEQDRRYYERYLERTKQTDDEPGAARDRESFVARADELIRDRNHRVATTERYRVQTDDPRLDVQAVAAHPSARSASLRRTAELMGSRGEARSDPTAGPRPG